MRDVYDCNKLIFAGDFNVVFRSNEVKNRIFTRTEQRFAQSLENDLENAGLVDGWSEQGEVAFTWMNNRNGKTLHSTLDRVLFSRANIALKSLNVDWSVSVSDHAAVIAHLNVKSKSPKPFVHVHRLNSDLLKDAQWTSTLDNQVNELFQQRNPQWDPHQTLEFLKMCIRTAATSATGILRSSFKDEEKLVNDNINKLVGELKVTDPQDPSYDLKVALLNDQRNVKRELVQKLGTKIEQRTARKWYNEGELSNKYFFGLLNRRVCDKLLILDHNGREITEEEEINNTVVNFYKELYEEELIYDRNNDIEFFRYIDQVSTEAGLEVVQEITSDELRDILLDCDDSAPGPDGIT